MGDYATLGPRDCLSSKLGGGPTFLADGIGRRVRRSDLARELGRRVVPSGEEEDP